MPTLLRPRYWGGHLAVLASVAAAVLLGLWQLHVWQAARSDAAQNITRAAPRALSSVMGGDDTFPGRDLGRPVRFSGRWLTGSTVYVEDRVLHGRRGYWVVTPVLVGRSAMPVVRGWAARPEAPPVSGSTTVTGWLQPSEDSDVPDDDPHDDVLPELRIASLVERVDSDLYSAFVVERSPRAPGLAPVTPQSIPSVSGLTSLRNLLYAFQWWIFGGFAVYVWQRWCRDQLADAGEPDEPEPDQPQPDRLEPTAPAPEPGATGSEGRPVAG